MRENAMTIIARESKDACRLSLSLMLLLATVVTANAGSLGGPLDLQDFGSFFVGGRSLESTHPGPGPTGPVPAGQIRTGQMYVQYLIPKTVSGPAIVMVPGAVIRLRMTGRRAGQNSPSILAAAKGSRFRLRASDLA
jgi:hypothetical protein